MEGFNWAGGVMRVYLWMRVMKNAVLGAAACVLVGMDFPVLGGLGGDGYWGPSRYYGWGVVTRSRTVGGESRDYIPDLGSPLLPGFAARI